MKKLRWAVSTLVAMFIATGCNDKKTQVLAEDVDTLEVDSVVVIDTTVYGRCGEGTAMHTLEMITDKGDTVVYALENDDTTGVVLGGLLVGDKLAVIEGKSVDGERFAEKVINLTTLLGKWVSLDKTFEIREGGVVVSNAKEPKPYVDWRILNGKLLLSSDTFDIYSLGADSLYLENDNGIYAYRRIVVK